MLTEKEKSPYQIGDMLLYDKSMYMKEYYIVTDITLINGWPVQYDLIQLDNDSRCELTINGPVYKRFKKIS